MTVKELIDILHDYPENATIHFQYPSHDYWQTQLVAEVKSVENRETYYSTYHETTAIAKERSDDLDEDNSVDENNFVLVLQGNIRR